jgi:hypothetical protein
MNHTTHIKLLVTVVAGFLLLGAFGVPIGSYFPLAIFLVCPLMMIFMMRGMNHGGGGSNQDAAQPDGETPTAHRH